jgi:hypothetical protein
VLLNYIAVVLFGFLAGWMVCWQVSVWAIHRELDRTGMVKVHSLTREPVYLTWCEDLDSNDE